MASNNYSLLLLLFFAATSSSAVSADPDLSGLLNSLSQGSVTSLHDTMQCMQKLLPCKSYLNASATEPPPETCCSPLKDMVDSDFECVCQFYNDPQILNSMNITRDDALQLPKACNVRLRLSRCQEASSPSPATTPTDPVATEAAAAAVLAAAQKSISAGADGNKDAHAATSSGSTIRITFFGGVVVASASLLFIMN